MKGVFFVLNKQEPYIGMPINLMELEALPLGCPKDTSAGALTDTSANTSASASSKQKLQPMVLAMAYVPWQRFEKTYDLNEALEIGTIFPELDLPFLGYKGGRQR